MSGNNNKHHEETKASGLESPFPSGLIGTKQVEHSERLFRAMEINGSLAPNDTEDESDIDYPNSKLNRFGRYRQHVYWAVAALLVIVVVGASVIATRSSRTDDAPTEAPTLAPSPSPTLSPTQTPSHVPSLAPSTTPSTAPSTTPSSAPTNYWQQVGDDVDGASVLDYMGGAIALSANGTTVAAGARANGGLVRVFAWDHQKEEWQQVGADMAGENDRWGHAVDLSADGTIVAAGAVWNDGGTGSWYQGQVRVMEYDGSNWNPLGQDLDGEAAGDSFGGSVALSSDGTVLAAGGPTHDVDGPLFNAGHVRIFSYDRLNNQWSSMGEVNGMSPSDMLGSAVDLSADGRVLATGATMQERNGLGQVRVFAYDGDQWIPRGQNLDGVAAGDEFGGAVALSADGNTVAAGGAKHDGSNGPHSGHVRVFVYDSVADRWSQLGQILEGEGSEDEFGESVSLSADGRTVAAGAKWNDGRRGVDSGSVRIYEYDSLTETWQILGQDLDGEAATDLLGESVALSADGTIVAAGAAFNDGNGNRSGHIRVFGTHGEKNRRQEL